MTRYAAGIIFPDEVEKELDRLRGEFSGRMVYIPIPHITLAYPFTLGTDVGKLKELLFQVAAGTAKFRLVLDGFDYFRSDTNAAYVVVRNKKPVTDLHYDINRSIDGLVSDEYKGRYNLGNFVPHMTIGTEIPHDVFPEFKKRLEGLSMRYETDIDSFTLLSRKDDGEWETENVFSLGAQVL